MVLALTGSPPITAAALDAAVNTELASNWFPLAGTTAGGNAAAGTIGEYISAQGNSVALSTSVVANITSMSLTAGDWDTGGVVQAIPASSTILITTLGGISITSATMGGLGTFSSAINYSGTASGGNSQFITLPMVRLSLSTTTTVYCCVQAAFTTSTCAASAFICARRVR